MKIKEFIKAMSILGTAYNKEFTQEQIGIWYESFNDVDYELFKQAIKKIVKKNKFMPSIAELLDECRNVSKTNIEEIIEKMYQDGYFKDSKELAKVQLWIAKDMLPYWLKEDMKKYGFQENLQITNLEVKLLEES